MGVCWQKLKVRGKVLVLWILAFCIYISQNEHTLIVDCPASIYTQLTSYKKQKRKKKSNNNNNNSILLLLLLLLLIIITIIIMNNF